MIARLATPIRKAPGALLRFLRAPLERPQYVDGWRISRLRAPGLRLYIAEKGALYIVDRSVAELILRVHRLRPAYGRVTARLRAVTTRLLRA